MVLPVSQMVAAMLFLLYGEGERQHWDVLVVVAQDDTTEAKEDVQDHSSLSEPSTSEIA